MTTMINSILSVLLLITLFIPGESIGENIYKWKDEDGSLHFSNYIPERSNFAKGKLEGNKLDDFSNTITNNSRNAQPSTKIPLEHTVRSIFTITNGKSLGTGFFISSNGYAITCRHIIDENRDHIAILDDHKEYPVGIIATSAENDLALILVIAPFDTPFLKIRNPDTLRIDEQVYTVGSSLDRQTDIADGHFKGFRMREDTGDRVLQFSAPVDPGNSGSPLMDRNGRVVGIVSWKIVSKKGVPVFGLGFAVPSYHLLEEYGAFKGLY
ncbi:trypsin-like peptidase domain-containing protein [Thermodesulfobacteriota bacterium]